MSSKYVGAVIRRLGGHGYPFTIREVFDGYVAHYLDSGNIFPIDPKEVEEGVRSGQWVVVSTPPPKIKEVNGVVVAVGPVGMIIRGDDGLEYSVNFGRSDVKYILLNQSFGEEYEVFTDRKLVEERINELLDDDTNESDLTVYELGRELGFTRQSSVTLDA